MTETQPDLMTHRARTTVLSTDRSVIYFDKSLDTCGDPEEWFDPLNPELQSEIVQVGGRSAAWYVQIGDQSCVLRHYHRGGLAAKFLVNQYVWTGAASSRAVTEFLMMQSLYEAGLSVPQPLAAGVWRTGLTYRAALITARIQGVVPLAHVADPVAWEFAGREIAKMHHAEIWHADLNVFNVLIDSQSRAWLIDFDRARAGYQNPFQRSENLARLLRSVRKVCPEMERDFWPTLTNAYAVEEQALLRIGQQ